MDINEILLRIGYVRNQAHLSARELSLRLGMSEQYVAKVENGQIRLSMEKLLEILEICEFPIERFFSADIEGYEQNEQLRTLIEQLPADKKRNIIEFISK